MRFTFTAVFFVSTFFGIVFSQSRMIIPNAAGHHKQVHHGSTIIESPCAGSIRPKDIEANWKITLQNMQAVKHSTNLSTEAFEILKKQANEVREKRKLGHQEDAPTRRNIMEGPQLTKNFRGNTAQNSVPMDNSFAISRNGFIVSGINSNIIFTRPDGVITYAKSLPDFFTLLNLGTRMYDPRIIYDVEENKFIAMCLHGSEPSNTFLCLAFSKTEDPNGEWFYYKVDGNPSGDERWFDYPNIGLSKKDYYLAGLMRDINGDWQYSVVYQMDKNDGFNGRDLRWKYYNEIKDADGKSSFNLVPAQNGWNQLLGPGMYFVSNEAQGGDTYNLYYTDAALDDNPTLSSLQTRGLLTRLAPDGRQKGTNNVLNTFDSRIWSAMHLNGIIHMGSHVNTDAGDVGLFYGRFDIADLKVDAEVLTTPNIDYGFPSFTAFGSTESSADILVNYLYSGSDVFAGQEQRVCSGIKDQFLWSEATTLKEGRSIINALTENQERWGDYTTACRRFIGNRVESWVVGSYGEGGGYGNWIGQLRPIEDKAKVDVEFVSDFTTLEKNNAVTFSDISTPNAVSWEWYFEGGNPSVSNVKNPVVTYVENGSYDVQLIITTALGNDTLLKTDYIHIQNSIIKPVTDFTQNKDTIYQEQTVRYTDQSTDNVVNYKWTFQNGIPSSSSEKNPVIMYKKLGTHLVSLTTSNIAGFNTKTKTKAITVIERTVPKVAFTADKTMINTADFVAFRDLSTGGVTEWNWTFEGGNPSTSTLEQPTVQYSAEGSYAVSLKVSNGLGSDVTTLSGYITVSASSVAETEIIHNCVIYPNPSSGGMMTLRFNQAHQKKIAINLINAQGVILKQLYNDRVKQGENILQFNTEVLPNGHYTVSINDGARFVKSIPFVVQR